MRNLSLSSCSIHEVADIGYGRKDGKELFVELLKIINAIATTFDLKKKAQVPSISAYVVPTYVWSGVVKGRANGAFGEVGPAFPFNGLTLANYINSQDIGKCGMSEAQPNAYHAGDRLTQAFVWAPDFAKLQDWAKKELVF